MKNKIKAKLEHHCGLDLSKAIEDELVAELTKTIDKEILKNLKFKKRLESIKKIIAKSK